MPEFKKEDYVQNKEIRFTGISRSGNHAIINWLINQIEGDYCFLNCTEPKHNPFKTARPLAEGGSTYRTNIQNFQIQEEQLGRFSIKDYLIYSHEDCFLGGISRKVSRSNHDTWVGTSRNITNILIMRDPFNLFASRIKSNLMWGHYTHHGVKPISTLTLKRIYKQHAREFLGLKHNLKDAVKINFNEWSSSPTYRRNIANELEIPFSDMGFDEVSSVAGGSSFDGLKHRREASKMKLQSRWKEYQNDEGFWDLFDEELVELSREIFGDTAGALHFHEMQDRKVVYS